MFPGHGQGSYSPFKNSTLTMASYIFLRSLFVSLLIFSSSLWAATPAQMNIDDELGRVISSAYNRIAGNSTAGKNLAEVLVQAEKAYQTKDYAGALHILATHHALAKSRLDDEKLQAVTRLALQVYCLPLVEQLLTEARQQGDSLAEAKLIFELVRFYAENEHWSKITVLLKDPSLLEQLSGTDTAEGYVLLGTALQKQKKHREAMRFYEKVITGSDHFRIAQLNLASALLRQEWWTDAQIAINAALKENKAKRDELDFRMFTMLGYSQIQFGFYRDARESFRNVALSSQYAQRALLGLGIAALHQQDFIGALNAFDKLRTQTARDISVAEAHLLSAFTLRQLEQFDAATGHYQEAIDYYQNLSAEIDTLLKSTTSVSIHFLRPENNNDKKLINTARKIALLNGVGKYVAETPGIALLNAKLGAISAERAAALLREEKNAIDSYLSQSRFGLASLYDQK